MIAVGSFFAGANRKHILVLSRVTVSGTEQAPRSALGGCCDALYSLSSADAITLIGAHSCWARLSTVRLLAVVVVREVVVRVRLVLLMAQWRGF